MLRLVLPERLTWLIPAALPPLVLVLVLVLAPPTMAMQPCCAGQPPSPAGPTIPFRKP